MQSFLRIARRIFRGRVKADDPGRPLLDRLQARWASEGIRPRRGVSPEVLAWFEDRYRVVLPPAVRAYYEAVDGTGDDVDADYFRFWPFAEFAPISESWGWEPAEAARFEGRFVFADHMIDAPDFAVRLSPDPAGGGAVACLWIIYPRHRKVYVYDSPSSLKILLAADELVGEPVLPGFRLPLTSLFELR